MKTTAEMTTTALANWFGSNRFGAERVGREMGPCKWAGVVFAGGMSEVPEISARQLVINDLHRAVMNLGRVTADPKLRAELQERVLPVLYHPDVLAEAQAQCITREQSHDLASATGLFAPEARVATSEPDLDWAVDYFIASWMGRGSNCGTDGEFRGGLSVRFDAGGGGSSVRYRSAVRSLNAWGAVLERAEFTTLDFREFIGKCHDRPGHALYADPPFPEKGDTYKSKFKPADHRDLCRLLGELKSARVVIRYHDHPLIRELYPRDRWTWVEWEGRNDVAAEVMLINGPSFAAPQ